MIPEIEIREDAREWSLRAEVVEKDYVLGWVLSGIAHNPTTNAWVFKGGTCLKKCFFETYRFSEDLDFTIPSEKPCDVDTFKLEFASISDWVYEKSGIEIPKDMIAFEAYQNPRGRTSVAGKISYRGPLQPRGTLPRIKLDLTQDELLVTGPVARLSEPDHPCKIPGAKAIPIGGHQFCRQCRQNVLAVGSSLVLQNVLTDAPADTPVEPNEAHVDCLGHLAPGNVDQPANVCQ